MKIRTKSCRPATLCILAGLTLLGCGDEMGAVGPDTDTDTQTEEASTGMEDAPTSTGSEPSDESTGTSAAETSGSSGDTDDPPGETDETSGGSTGEEPEPALDTDAYRITWTSHESLVTRLQTSAGDFSDQVSLSPAGVDGVALAEYGQRPKMHPDGRTLGFIWGNAFMTADVVTGETNALTYDGTAVRTFAWAPSAREVAWIDNDLRFRRAEWDGNETTQIRNLENDGLAADQIQFAWSPLEDRFWANSRPAGIPNTITWAVDSDGTDYGVVAESTGSNVGFTNWTTAGDSMFLVANVDSEIQGRELHLGERDELEMVSHPTGNVSRTWRSADGSRIMYFSRGNGLFSLSSDGTDLTLIDAGTPESPDLVSATINDDGSFAAWTANGALTAVQTTLHTPLLLEADSVDASSVQFIPGGAWLAYIKDETESGGQRTLWMVDGDGQHLMNHDLEDGANVSEFQWFQGGLTYTVVDADDRPVLHHTDMGETPLFIPTPSEWGIRAYPSPDEDLLIVRLTGIDFENGRLCAFDVRDITQRVALGCESIHINGTVSVFVTQPER